MINDKTLPMMIWAGWLALAVLLRFGPASLPSLVEVSTVQVAGFGLNFFPEKDQTQSAVTHRETTAQLQTINRQLMLQVAQLQERLREQQAVPNVIQRETKPLVDSRQLPARVLGVRKSVADQNLDLLIALGKQKGLVEDVLVLKGPGVLLDQGEIAGIEADQLVSQGNQLFGRTSAVGSWTSLVQPITDVQFRIAIKLVRNSPLGPVWGATGLLAGTGQGCSILEVPATQPVAIGDYVFTQPQLLTNSDMVYCGRITKADVGHSDVHWTIEVQPAVSINDLPSELVVIQGELDGSTVEPVRSLNPESTR